jgi:hypothetical protein
MSILYDYGEGLLCFVPVFAIIAVIFFGLLWNSLPSKSGKDKK